MCQLCTAHAGIHDGKIKTIGYIIITIFINNNLIDISDCRFFLNFFSAKTLKIMFSQKVFSRTAHSLYIQRRFRPIGIDKASLKYIWNFCHTHTICIALSAARPGARRETLDAYIKRLEKLEEIANTTPGVDKSFAIQAGREIRIIAKPEEVNDESIALLAREISKKIESELEYPGQIKVNVVRETRAIDYAK